MPNHILVKRLPKMISNLAVLGIVLNPEKFYGFWFIKSQQYLFYSFITFESEHSENILVDDDSWQRGGDVTKSFDDGSNNPFSSDIKEWFFKLWN